MSWTDAASVLGGIGLFLLGMRLMTDGLRLVAGNALARILERSTATQTRGVLTGMLITALVQSSSAVTVATIGFANAGLLGLKQAVLVVYGSNVGTTVTAWLVALVGFSVDVRALALPLIGGGMLLRMMRPRARSAALGEALAGFGIFFFGIEVLHTAFASAGDRIAIGSTLDSSVRSVAIAVASGFLLTVLMQSSSAAVAIVLTAAAGSMIPIAPAAGAVIGANVGTTVTAGLAAIGATPNAKRVAGAHLAFNFLTGLVAVALLPALLALLLRVRAKLGMDAAAPAVLASFHTLFNLMGLFVMLPLTDRLVRFLRTLFRSTEEDEASPRYLDHNLVGTPTIALEALRHELARIARIALRIATGMISAEAPNEERLASDRRTLEKLVDAAGAFVNQVQRANLSSAVAESLSDVLRVTGYYVSMMDVSLQIAHNSTLRWEIPDASLALEMTEFKGAVVRLLEVAKPEAAPVSSSAASEQLAGIRERYETLKSRVLRAGVAGSLRTGHLVGLLEMMHDARDVAVLAEKATRVTARIGTAENEPTPPMATVANGPGKPAESQSEAASCD